MPSSFRRARLIVLSAFSTGHQAKPAMSIATALLRQDVPTVVYTVWAIGDDAAADLARRFHQSLARGQNRAAAVREAQLLMRQGPAGFHESSAWGAFQLAGAPGACFRPSKQLSPLTRTPLRSVSPSPRCAGRGGTTGDDRRQVQRASPIRGAFPLSPFAPRAAGRRWPKAG